MKSPINKECITFKELQSSFIAKYREGNIWCDVVQEKSYDPEMTFETFKAKALKIIVDKYTVDLSDKE